MHIQFGFHLDGLDPAPPKTAIAEATVGPQGLIRMLESDLGLPPVLQHPAERLVAYRGCLTEADTIKRFYHRSFAVDPISVARTLDGWRGQWYDAGWNGTFAAEVCGRLTDMAAVERLAADRVPLSNGQRVARILESLHTRRTQIETLILHDDPASLPFIWQILFNRLGFEVAPGARTTATAPGTDLHAVQERLIALSGEETGEPPPVTPLNQDGSFIVVRAASRDISARAIAETVRAHNAAHETVVIAENDGIILDNAMERSGLPRSGFQHYSRFRAVSQVLKLCLALLWEPINPHLLLQFLIHPLGPVPGNLRSRLAEAVSREPGIGGRAWNTAVERLEQDLLDRDAPAREFEQLRSTIREWFEAERFDPVAGAGVAVLTERAQRISTWLARRLSQMEEPGERAMFASALAQAETLMTSFKQLEDQGRDMLPKIELERLVDEVARQQPDPTVFAEAGRVRATTHPGTITRPWHRVVWWDLAAQQHELSYPWSAAELDGLRASGVALPTIEDELKQRSLSWLKPIANCTGQLILVVHHSDEGYHPLWSQISSVFSNWAEVDLETILLDGTEAEIPFLGVQTRPLEATRLPSPQRWWELAAEVTIPSRSVESYSSLSKLFYSPHQWVLNYPAALRTGRAEDLADGPLLYGNLAHRLFEEFFNAQPNWRELDHSAIHVWLDSAIPRLVREEGAVLLEPGRGVDHEQVVTTLERALLRLVEQLVSANVVSVKAEHDEEESFGVDGINIRGTIDLVLTREDGEEVVLDAKWGGQKRRGEELEENLHLQLASYAYMRKTATGANQWPYQAYFIVTTGNVLAQDNSVFPEALVYAPDEEADVAGLWAAGQSTYRWRREQLDAGHIEVNAEGTEDTAASESPDDALETRVAPSIFDDYKRLAGWDEFA